MDEALPIMLPQLVLWYDSTRIQTWPALVAQVDANVVLPSSTDFGRAHLSDRMTDDRHAAAEKITRNMPGLEKRGNRLVLRGIGLLEQTEQGYCLSDSGRELGAAYRSGPEGTDWVRILGRLLLGRDPRTRTFIRLLSEPDATLYFTSESWWGGSLERAAINCGNGREILPFAKSDTPIRNLRTAIKDSAWWALGDWRTHPYVDGARDCRFIGQLKADFSLHDISLALRAASEVFLHLGVLKHEREQCWLDHAVAAQQFGPAFAQDFGWQPQADPKSLAEVLVELLPDLRMDTGFVVASVLRDRLRQIGVQNPDRDIAQLEAEGRLVIEASDYGQGRHGVGLYNDPSKQLIKLRLC